MFADGKGYECVGSLGTAPANLVETVDDCIPAPVADDAGEHIPPT